MSNKIRAVYEALDSRKTKQALKLLGPLLEKKPDSAQLRILKALALVSFTHSSMVSDPMKGAERTCVWLQVRSGRVEEGLKIGRELKSNRVGWSHEMACARYLHFLPAMLELLCEFVWVLLYSCFVLHGVKSTSASHVNDGFDEQEVEADETLLSNLAVVFREGSVPNESTEIYVLAWERQPAHEGLARYTCIHTHLHANDWWCLVSCVELCEAGFFFGWRLDVISMEHVFWSACTCVLCCGLLYVHMRGEPRVIHIYTLHTYEYTHYTRMKDMCPFKIAMAGMAYMKKHTLAHIIRHAQAYFVYACIQNE